MRTELRLRAIGKKCYLVKVFQTLKLEILQILSFLGTDIPSILVSLSLSLSLSSLVSLSLNAICCVGGGGGGFSAS
jgi:hypothetical protein